jgi:hypothetical protein
VFIECQFLTSVIYPFFPLPQKLFADIAGFTAWSSEREPSQVFILLETLYQNFDTLANRLGGKFFLLWRVLYSSFLL